MTSNSILTSDAPDGLQIEVKKPSILIATEAPRLALAFGAVLLVATTVGLTATPYMAAATLAYGIMTCGVFYRRIPTIHSKMMTSAMLIDLCIVLALEVNREAVKTAFSFTLTPLEQGHIAASSAATALYIPVLVLGWMRYRRQMGATARRWHVRLGVSAYVFRSVGFVLMFALLERVTHLK